MTTFDVALVSALAVQSPDPDRVKAGWVALVLFLVLAAVVAFLGFSLVKHLRRARDNFEQRDAAERGDEPDQHDGDGDPHRP